MRVFIGYGYHERDKWIEEFVFDLVRAFGFEPVSGKELYGQNLSEGVRNAIAQSYGLLGFTTKRENEQGKQEGTHRWVIEELSIAETLNKPSVEIIETGLTQLGQRVGRQYITYDPGKRDRVLLDLALALGKWREELPVLAMLLPSDVIAAIRPNASAAGLRCTYKILRDGNEIGPREGKLLRMKGGIFVALRDVDENCLVSISISFGNQTWESGYDSLYRTITLDSAP